MTVSRPQSRNGKRDAISYFLPYRITSKKFLNNKNDSSTGWLAKYDASTPFSQKSTTSELKRSQRPEVPTQPSHLVDKCLRPREGRALAQSHSRGEAQPDFKPRLLQAQLEVLFHISCLSFLCPFQTSFIGSRKQGRQLFLVYSK